MTTQAAFTARLDRASFALIAGAPKRKARQLRRRANAAIAGLTLESYVAWINREADGFALMGADGWRERGVTTAPELARILDAECRRNREKEERYAD